MIIRVKIDLKKLNQDLYFRAQSGAVYADLTLLEDRNGEDQYGNHFMVVQDVGKERREKGEKGPIIGNGKFVGERPQSAQQASPAPRSGQQRPQPKQTPPPTDDGFDPCPF